MRNAKLNRKTAETDISLFLSLDGTGVSNITTDCGFLKHMLTLFSKHSRFDLDLVCKGDSEVDFHHTVEDIGIVLGTAFRSALGDCAGIKRYGSFFIPMDETLLLVAVDISGRSKLCFDLQIPAEKVGDFDTELCEEFFEAFCREAGITLHLRQMCGKNSHHIIEAAFKGLGRALGAAAAVDAELAGEIPSTKGVI